MRKGKPIGTPVNKGPWPKGTWVWHVRTKKGPWVVVEDTGGQLVYVDTAPNRPASKTDYTHIRSASRYYVALGHSDVKHFYRSMLTDEEPPTVPHWSTKLDWKKIGMSFGVGFAVVLLIASYCFVFQSTIGSR